MSAILAVLDLQIPKLVRSMVLEPPLTDEEFEKLSASNELL